MVTQLVLLFGYHALAAEAAAVELVLPDGAVYRGVLQDGLLTGTGTLHWPNGDLYRGEFRAGRMHGHGVFEYRTGERYEGDFSMGTRHGQGELATRDGETYRGRFIDDGFTGQGRHEYRGRLIYDGTFRNWKYHGYGRLIWGNGDEYIGEFEDDEFHGEGEVIYKQARGGKHRLAGYWEHGRYTGSHGEDEPSQPDDRTPAHKLDTESLLFRQQRLLDAELASVPFSAPERIDIYFLGFAGDGGQDIFMKEAQFASAQIHRRYDTGERSLLLMNNSTTAESIPLATATNLRYALHAIAKKMQSEDILFLFLTSHGSEDHELVVDLGNLSLRNLSADTLAHTLRESGIKWKIVVISACYAGGFIPTLADEFTLIVTAASAENVSFGCTDDTELTYFGRAFFGDSLASNDTLPTVFEKAYQRIKEMEAKKDYDHSDPQIYHTPTILEHLDKQRRQ